MSSIYITEPDAIDVDNATRLLKRAGFRTAIGSKAFDDSHLHDYETIIIRSQTMIDADIKKHFPHLKNIVRIGTGLDNIDLEFCRASRIAVYNAAGANADAVSDYVVCMALHALRKVHHLTEDDVQHWNRFKFVGNSLADQTIGIVGFGNIGKAVYKKLSGFSCTKFLAYDPFLTPDKVSDYDIELVSLHELLRKSTIISLHLPLNRETKYLINAKNLPLIQQNSIIINAARGGIVDERAVLDSLERRDFTYIADAVENEPDIRPELLTNNNIIITPHIASLTDTSEKKMLSTAVDNFLRGNVCVV